MSPGGSVLVSPDKLLVILGAHPAGRSVEPGYISPSRVRESELAFERDAGNRKRGDGFRPTARYSAATIACGFAYTGLLHHHRKSMNIKELRIRTWVNASDCPARSYAQSVAPGAVSSLLQATYVDQEKQRKSCPYKDLCLYC